VTAPLESTGGVAIAVVGVLLLAFVAYWTFGPQALGLPAMVGVLALWGLTSLVSNAGLGALGVVVVIGGLIALMLIIGMAMRFGADPSTRKDIDDQR
jgi:hypothetical protein